MIDAVNPANIPAGYNGTLALKITVEGSPAGQAFDIEPGNPDAAAQWPGMAARLANRQWVIAYVNQSTEQSVTDLLRYHYMEWSPANLWPEPGVYEWCADPSGNIHAGRWEPATAPIAIQDRYMGGYDLSATYGIFPAKVAGYIDGPVSTWPPEAWRRFVALPDAGWSPDPTPTPNPVPSGAPSFPGGRKRMYLANDGTTQFTVTTDANGVRTKQGIGTLADADHPELQQLAAVFGNLGTCPTFLSECKTVG